MKIFNVKDGFHCALWLEHGTLKKQHNSRWDEGPEDGRVRAVCGINEGWVLLPRGPWLCS